MSHEIKKESRSTTPSPREITGKMENYIKTETWQRIKIVRKLMGKNKSEFAREFDYDPSTAMRWEKSKEDGGNPPKIDDMIKMAVLGNVCFEWLATGRGTMMYDNDISHISESMEQYSTNCVMLDVDETKLLKHFRSLPKDKKKSLLLFLIK